MSDVNGKNWFTDRIDEAKKSWVKKKATQAVDYVKRCAKGSALVVAGAIGMTDGARRVIGGAVLAPHSGASQHSTLALVASKWGWANGDRRRQK